MGVQCHKRPTQLGCWTKWTFATNFVSTPWIPKISRRKQSQSRSDSRRGQVFKTLVAHGDRHGICMAVIPGDTELSLKALAAASDNRKVHLVPVKDLQKLTGYVRGGVTALAAKRDYPLHADEKIGGFETISISAGIRGLQILLPSKDYLKVTRAYIAAIAPSKNR